MKQLVISFFLFTTLQISAQTLTQSFNEPVVGDIDKSYRLDTSAYTNGMPVTQTGTNCVWNFSNLTGTFPMVVDSFINPSAAIGATAYPSATFVQHRDLLYTFYKSTTSPSQTELLGAYSPSLSLTFTNSAIIAGYPINYGYNVSDPVSGSFKYNTNNGACNGNITISVPGTGTLTMPGNVTIPNVLCLRSVEILTLSLGILPFGTFNQTIYNFYMPGKKFPVLNINYTSYQVLTGAPTINNVVYGSNNYFTVAGVNENHAAKLHYEVFPNPFHDELSITGLGTNEECTYSFYDATGRLSLQTNKLSGDEVQKLIPGIYFFEIKNKSGVYHQKIIKE